MGTLRVGKTKHIFHCTTLTVEFQSGMLAQALFFSKALVGAGQPWRGCASGVSLNFMLIATPFATYDVD